MVSIAEGGMDHLVPMHLMLPPRFLCCNYEATSGVTAEEIRDQCSVVVHSEIDTTGVYKNLIGSLMCATAINFL